MLQKPFKEAHKIDSLFGEPRSYGLHSGEDWNGIKGGNTDCGYKLYPIDLNNQSEIVHSSQSNTGYGNIVVYKIVGNWGERWVRYCHCSKLLVRSGLVSPQVPIAELGTSGNSTGCHLHWDVIKKPMRNWRTYARDKLTLEEYFEKPSAFFEQWKNVQEEEDMPEYFKNLLHEYQLDLNNESQIRSFFDKGRNYDDKIKGLTSQVETANETISSLSLQVAELTPKVTKMEEEISGLKGELVEARNQRDTFSIEKERLEVHARKLEEEVGAFQEHNDIMAYSLWERFISLFKRTKKKKVVS